MPPPVPEIWYKRKCLHTESVSGIIVFVNVYFQHIMQHEGESMAEKLRIIQLKVPEEVFTLHTDLRKMLRDDGVLFWRWFANVEATEYQRRKRAQRQKATRRG